MRMTQQYSTAPRRLRLARKLLSNDMMMYGMTDAQGNTQRLYRTENAVWVANFAVEIREYGGQVWFQKTFLFKQYYH